jgi:hypothetical protein
MLKVHRYFFDNCPGGIGGKLLIINKKGKDKSLPLKYLAGIGLEPMAFGL